MYLYSKYFWHKPQQIGQYYLQCLTTMHLINRILKGSKIKLNFIFRCFSEDLENFLNGYEVSSSFIFLFNLNVFNASCGVASKDQLIIILLIFL